MIIAIDVYYRQTDAKTVGLIFNQWEDTTPINIIIEYSSEYGEYEPGAFYKRELPCIQNLLTKIDLSTLDYIIIDGYVFLDNEGKAGLGLYLYKALQEQIPVIGVAKKAFHSNKEMAQKVYRGESMNPLYITSVGIEPEQAANYIKRMDGNYRIPTLLKLVDSYTKEE